MCELKGTGIPSARLVFEPCKYLVDAYRSIQASWVENGRDLDSADFWLWHVDAMACAQEALTRRTVEEVERARSEGASWTGIGRKLGVSKQAAQQKYGKRQAALTEWRGGATEPTLV